MPFRSGTVSYSRFGVSGNLPDDAGEGALALLSKHIVKPRGLSEEGTASGWCTGRHVFDADFGWEHCGFSGALLCAMRIENPTLGHPMMMFHNQLPHFRNATMLQSRAGEHLWNPSCFLGRKQMQRISVFAHGLRYRRLVASIRFRND